MAARLADPGLFFPPAGAAFAVEALLITATAFFVFWEPLIEQAEIGDAGRWLNENLAPARQVVGFTLSRRSHCTRPAAAVRGRPVWVSLLPMKARTQAHLLRVSFTLLAACSSAAGLAQDLRSYPAATIKFLDVELPLINAAVAAKDRAYFSGSNARVQAFLDGWGLKSNPVAIEAFPVCTDAVTDFQIVGLCRISPPGTIYEPATFIPKFEKNLALCRVASSRQ